MEWLNPQVTKNITGAQAPMKRLIPSLPDRLSSTPMVTRMLHRMPMKKAFWKGMVILLTAVRMEATARAPLPAESQPNWAQMKDRTMEPTKFPMYTKIQLRSIPPRVAFFSRTLMVMRVLPVKSSAPEITTIPKPKAKSRPEIMRMVELLSRA